MENTSYYLLTQLSFVVLSGLCLFFIYLGLRKALVLTGVEPIRRKRIMTRFVAGILIWIGMLTGLSVSGFLRDFSVFPPRMLLVLVIPLVVVVWITFSKGFTQLIRFVPPHWLVFLQSFRIFVEILLWWLFLDNLLPVQMTFEGRNLDILTGLLAPMAGLGMMKLTRYRTVIGLVFNVIGLGLLINIVSVAILSMPTPFRVFMNEPANTIVASFPIVFLPGILVPVAYALHFFSLRQLLTQPVGLEKKQTSNKVNTLTTP